MLYPRHPLYLSQSPHSRLCLPLPLGRTHVARSCKVFLVGGGGGGGECDGDSGETLWPASVEAALALGLC